MERKVKCNSPENHPRQPDDAGGLQQKYRMSRRHARRKEIMAHRKLRSVRLGEHINAAVRERNHDPLPDPGDAAHREDLRRRRHPAGDRGLCAADARRQQLEGDDADRVPRRQRAQARAGAPDRRRGPPVRRGRRASPRLRDRRRRHGPRERREDLGRAFRALRVDPAMCAAVKAGASVKLGCDHTNYPAHTTIAPETLASLARRRPRAGRHAAPPLRRSGAPARASA